MRFITLGDFLSPEQLRDAIALYQECQGEHFAARCAQEIIAPNIQQINRRLGQENDARYLAYACEHAIQSTIEAG